VRWRDHLAAAANATPDARALWTHIAHRYGLLGRVPAAGRLGRAAAPSTVASDLTVAICSPISGPERARAGRPLGRSDISLRDAREHVSRSAVLKSELIQAWAYPSGRMFEGRGGYPATQPCTAVMRSGGRRNARNLTFSDVPPAGVIIHLQPFGRAQRNIVQAQKTY
jgi:hypothetical protein